MIAGNPFDFSRLAPEPGASPAAVEEAEAAVREAEEQWNRRSLAWVGRGENMLAALSASHRLTEARARLAALRAEAGDGDEVLP